MRRLNCDEVKIFTFYTLFLEGRGIKDIKTLSHKRWQFAIHQIVMYAVTNNAKVSQGQKINFLLKV